MVKRDSQVEGVMLPKYPGIKVYSVVVLGLCFISMHQSHNSSLHTLQTKIAIRLTTNAYKSTRRRNVQFKIRYQVSFRLLRLFLNHEASTSASNSSIPRHPTMEESTARLTPGLSDDSCWSASPAMEQLEHQGRTRREASYE